MSIATKHGDGGETSLIGGARISKAELQVEAYGTVDELTATLGFARSICPHAGIRQHTEAAQRTLFRVGSAMARPGDAPERPPEMNDGDVEALTALVHSFESQPGMLADWSLPGSDPAAAAFDVARTVCRRAERAAVRLQASGFSVEPHVLAYLNRLSDVLWLFGRALELEAGAPSRLRDEAHPGPRWSRAW